jgi:hypothetical protein
MSSARILRSLLLLSTALALFCLLYPLYVIRPFRAQGTTELNNALLLLQWRSWLLPLLVVASLALAALLWRQSPRFRKRLGLVSLALLTCVSAVAARINVFEQMFHPIEAPAFLPAAQARFDAEDMVLAVTANNQSRAWPVRTLAYHHLINDTVGGVPLVATY